MMGFKVEEGKGGDTLDFDKNADTTWHKCQAERYFGGPRVHKGIFAAQNDFVAMMWNQKFGVVFETFNPEQLGASLVHLICRIYVLP
eukprot:4046294-Pleurochrysis_carterae.AAC.1